MEQNEKVNLLQRKGCSTGTLILSVAIGFAPLSDWRLLIGNIN